MYLFEKLATYLYCVKMHTKEKPVGKLFYVAYCIIVYLEYFPRLIKLIKTKSSNDYSLGSITLSLTGMFCWIIYLFTTEQDLILYIGAVIDIVLNIVFAILVFKYHKNERNL